MEREIEEWRAIYNGFYAVSSLGRIKRLKCLDHWNKGRENKVLKPSFDASGYQIVSISINGKRKTRTVHTIVAETFLGERNKGITVNHKNGIKSDNRAENLEYATYKENSLHSRRVLGIGIGDKNTSSKLRDSDIPKIIALRASGLTILNISKQFKVCEETIRSIVAGNSWTHIPRERING